MRLEFLGMSILQRLFVAAVIATFIGAVARPAAVAADDDLPDNPAAAQKTDKASDAAAELKKIVERLKGPDREALEQRIKTGKVPDDARNQRIIPLLEMSYLGSTYYGSATNPRYFAVKLTLVNLTGEPVVLNRDETKLVSDGQTYPVKEAPEH